MGKIIFPSMCDLHIHVAQYEFPDEKRYERLADNLLKMGREENRSPCGKSKYGSEFDFRTVGDHRRESGEDKYWKKNIGTMIFYLAEGFKIRERMTEKETGERGGLMVYEDGQQGLMKEKRSIFRLNTPLNIPIWIVCLSN